MIVTNTTPISNFLHLGQMEILKAIFNELHIPMAVHSESEACFSDDQQWQKCLDENFIIRAEVQTSPKIKELINHLHLGEAEALCLCVENNAQLCLLDDRDARISEMMGVSSRTNTPPRITISIINSPFVDEDYCLSNYVYFAKEFFVLRS